MELAILVDFVQRLWEAFSNSYFFAAFKIFMGIYVAVLLIDIVLLLGSRDLREDLRKDLFGAANVSPASQSKMRKKWRAIEDRLKSGNPSEYKVALLEADAMMDKVLADMGYKGENMMDRLNQINPTQMEDVEALKETHQLRNQVVFEHDFVLDRDRAEKAVKVYETVLSKMEVF
jgi:hypothetical protein